jgi:hypothetical protein
VVDEKDFQQRIQKIGGLVQELETVADPAARSAAKELVQLLMDLHGAGLERMLEVIFQSPDGDSQLIDRLGQDPLVSSLLILYGLHPEDFQTRVERKFEQLRSKLHKMGAELLQSSVDGTSIRLRIKLEGHTCGSTARSVEAAVQEALYEAAPDLTSLVIEGLEEPAASGFVGIETLTGSSLVGPSLRSAMVATPLLNSEGMD